MLPACVKIMDHKKQTDPFYGSDAWHRARQLALQRDGGMCQECMRRYRDGLIRKPHRADMVHHIIPREQRPDLALDLNNLESLCNTCHNRAHPEKGRRQAEEHSRPGRMRVIKV